MKVFEPALYSLEENKFLAEHVGESPTVALHGGTPAGVNPKAIRPVLEKFYELEELRTHRGISWVGLEVIKNACIVYLQEYAKWEEMRRKGSPFPPTMFTWDQRGRPHRGAVDSDSGHVRTYFDEQGKRKRLDVALDDSEGAFVPDWVKNRTQVASEQPQELIQDEENGRVICPICKHTENYTRGVTLQQNMATRRMAKHLVKSRIEPDQHHILHAALFGAPDPSSN